MCVIVYKPKGQDLPSLDQLKKCFKNNHDGAGYMYADPIHKQVIISKGFMTFDDFMNDLELNLACYDIKEISLVMHFRITTQGGVKPELCHPYPLCDNYDTMRKLYTSCDLGIAHNGIISLTTNFNRNVDYNDTMTFIKDYMYLIIDNDIYWASNKNKVKLIENLTSGSKLAIMNSNGYVKLIGKFTKVNGIYYSNTYSLLNPIKTIDFDF